MKREQNRGEFIVTAVTATGVLALGVLTLATLSDRGNDRSTYRIPSLPEPTGACVDVDSGEIQLVEVSPDDDPQDGVNTAEFSQLWFDTDGNPVNAQEICVDPDEQIEVVQIGSQLLGFRVTSNFEKNVQ